MTIGGRWRIGVLVMAVAAALLPMTGAAGAEPGQLLTWPRLPQEVDDHYSIDSPAVAFYPSGAATVVTTRITDTGAEVVAFEASPSGAWSGPVVLSVPGVSSETPTIVTTGEGTAVAAWQRDSPIRDIQVSVRSADGSWSAPVVVSEDGALAGSPKLARDSNGTLILAYTADRLSCVGDRCASFAADVGVVEKPAGGSWSTTAWLTGSDSFVWLSGLRILPDDSVAIGVLWSNSFIYSNPYLEGVGVIRRPAGGAWQPLNLLWQVPNSGFTYGPGAWDVAADGTMAATYRRDGHGAYVRTLTPDGVLSPVVELAAPAAPEALSPAASWDSTGGLTVVWAARAIGSFSAPLIHAARRTPAGEWSAADNLGLAASSGRQGVVRAADDALTVWAQTFEGQVRARTRTADAGWQPALDVAPASGMGAYSAEVSPSGEVLIAYAGTDLTALQIGVRTTTTPTAPSSPTGLSATPLDRRVDVSWQPPASSGGAWVGSYTAVATPGGRSCTTVSALALAATSCSITGLTNGTAYTIAVTARNTMGPGPAVTTAGTVIPSGKPSAPPAVSAVARTRSASVSWAPPASNGGAAVSRYVVTAAPGGRTCATLGARTCTVTGLVDGRSYRFSVLPYNRNGAGPRSPSSAAVVPGTPAAPRNVAVKSVRKGRTTVTWSAPTHRGTGGVTSYRVRWSSNGGRSWSTWTNRGLATSATKTRTTKGRVYLVEVRATSRYGAGPLARFRFTQRR